MGKRLLLTAQDIMISEDELPIISKDALSKDVIKTISENGIGVTFVSSDNNDVIGIVTDGDVRND